MKNYFFSLVLAMLASQYSVAQFKNVNGLYIFYLIQERRNHEISGFKDVHLLNLTADNKFSYYQSSESDYTIEGSTSGKFKVLNDSILLVSQYPTTANVRVLPFCDTLEKDVIRLTFYDEKKSLDPPATGYEYYGIDDSLNLTKLDIVSTLPSQKDFFENITKEADHIGKQVKGSYQVLLKKDRPNISQIKVPGANLNEDFNKTNDFLINSNYVTGRNDLQELSDDVTGLKFSIVDTGLILVTKFQGTPDYRLSFRKLDLNELHYFKMTYSDYPDGALVTTSMQLNKRTNYCEISHDTSYYSSKKGNFKKENLYFTPEKYSQIINSISSLDFLHFKQHSADNYNPAGYNFLLHFNNDIYSIYTSIPSADYFNLITKILIQ